MEAGTDFLFLGSKIIADGDCSHEIDTCSLEEKAMTNLDSILKRIKKKKKPKTKNPIKSRDFILLTKVCLVKAMVFPAVMHRCERWTIKKAEH